VRAHGGSIRVVSTPEVLPRAARPSEARRTPTWRDGALLKLTLIFGICAALAG
jgi:hypothetical protein